MHYSNYKFLVREALPCKWEHNHLHVLKSLLMFLNVILGQSKILHSPIYIAEDISTSDFSNIVQP